MESMERDKSLLGEHGWSVECFSPFELRHWDGSFASGQAAVLVLDMLKRENSPDCEA